MKNNPIGQIIDLFISEKNRANKLSKSTLLFDKKGIIGDKYYDTDIQRSVLITSLSSYDLVSQHNIRVPHGILGENLLIDFNPYHLKAGVRLKIGSCILEISQNCTICQHLSNIDERLPVLLEKDRGIFAKVVQEGEIKVGDSIYM